MDEAAQIPTRGSAEAAGLDLYACRPQCVVIKPGETVKIGTGIAVAIPNGFFGAIFARSGMATKMGLRPANCVGVIDSDYRGEVIVALHNDSGESRVINGDKIAQLVIMPYVMPDGIDVVDDLDETERGAGGFGSTDNADPYRASLNSIMYVGSELPGQTSLL